MTGGIRLRVAPTFTGPPPSLSNAGAVVALGSEPLRAVVVAGTGRAPSCASDDAAPPSPPCFFNRVLEGGERASPVGTSSEVGGGRPDPTGGQVYFFKKNSTKDPNLGRQARTRTAAHIFTVGLLRAERWPMRRRRQLNVHSTPAWSAQSAISCCHVRIGGGSHHRGTN